MRDLVRNGGGADMRRLSGLGAELDRIEEMDPADLNAAWEARFGSAAPAPLPSRLLRLALAYDLQTKAQGGLSPAAERMLARGARGADLNGKTKPASLRLKPGSTLLRDWGGRTWRVEVEGDRAFRFEAKRWRSLSAIARRITGTSRNGPAFFGLRGGANDGSA